MCVLTYSPLPEGGFILTSNRDEQTKRSFALAPKKYWLRSDYPTFFPKDPQSGGTWIASSTHFTLCLLNGAFEAHSPEPPYRQSRGKVILDFHDFKSVENFYENYLFEGIEPFTLVIIANERNKELALFEIRWNGEKAFLEKKIADKPAIWSSVTLYSPEIIAERQNWFNTLLSEALIDNTKLLNFHHFGGKGDQENDMKVNRDGKLKTMSITQICQDNKNFTIYYEDLETNKSHRYRIL